jgi:hypothetical protein
MSYQTPRTWTQGELATPAHMNQEIRDNISALAQRGIVVQVGALGAGEIADGVALYVTIPFSCTITGWVLVGDASGSIVLDLWKAPVADFPPLVADTMTGTEKPTLSAGQIAQDLSLTTWDGDIDAGDVLAVNVDSCTGLEQVVLTLYAIPR